MKYHFSDKTSISLMPKLLSITELKKDISNKFEEANKPVFEYDTGEVVIEYTGLSSDGQREHSWAKATYVPNGYSSLHYHRHLEEDYYIMAGQAEVTMGGEVLRVIAGEQVQIKPGYHHQVRNISDKDDLVLIVKCTPAWTKEDFNLL